VLLEAQRQNPLGLDHPVEVTDVDAQFERTGGDDHTVPRFGEGGLRTTTLLCGQ